jgi:hypothetical protein
MFRHATHAGTCQTRNGVPQSVPRPWVPVHGCDPYPGDLQIASFYSPLPQRARRSLKEVAFSSPPPHSTRCRRPVQARQPCDSQRVVTRNLCGQLVPVQIVTIEGCSGDGYDSDQSNFAIGEDQQHSQSVRISNTEWGLGRTSAGAVHHGCQVAPRYAGAGLESAQTASTRHMHCLSPLCFCCDGALQGGPDAVLYCREQTWSLRVDFQLQVAAMSALCSTTQHQYHPQVDY